MAEIDKSRELAFDHGPSGLTIKIPIMELTPQWSAAFDELAHNRHLDAHLSHDRHHVIFKVSTETASRDELLRRLELLKDVVGQANVTEREHLDGTAPLEEVALSWWRRA